MTVYLRDSLVVVRQVTDAASRSVEESDSRLMTHVILEARAIAVGVKDSSQNN